MAPVFIRVIPMEDLLCAWSCAGGRQHTDWAPAPPGRSLRARDQFYVHPTIACQKALRSATVSPSSCATSNVFFHSPLGLQRGTRHIFDAK